MICCVFSTIGAKLYFRNYNPIFIEFFLGIYAFLDLWLMEVCQSQFSFLNKFILTIKIFDRQIIMNGQQTNNIFPQTFNNNLMKSGLRSLKQSSKYPSKISSKFFPIDEASEFDQSYALPKRHNKSVLNDLNKGSRQRSSKYPRINLREQTQNIFTQNHDLNEIEDIIDDIQEILTQNQKFITSPALFKSNFNPQKKRWHGKDITNKFKIESADRLEQLLFNYSTVSSVQPSLIINPQTNINKKSLQTVDRKKKIAQIKEYHKIQQNLKFVERKKKGFRQNVEVIEVDWMKLPIIPFAIKVQKMKNFVSIQNYPSNEQYEQIFKEKSQQINKYLQKSYSVFSGTGGINEMNELVSEEQFRSKWQQQSQVTNLNENQKQLLLQFELQWYYCIIQHCYNNSIEDILLKNITYDKEIYLQFIQDLNQKQDQTKNNIFLNKFKFLHEWISINQRQKMTFCLIRQISDDFNTLSQQVEPFFKTYEHQISKAANELQSDQIMIVAMTIQDIKKYNIAQINHTITINNTFKFYVNQEPNQKEQYIYVQKQNNSFILQVISCQNFDIKKLEPKQDLIFGHKFK